MTNDQPLTGQELQDAVRALLALAALGEDQAEDAATRMERDVAPRANPDELAAVLRAAEADLG